LIRSSDPLQWSELHTRRWLQHQCKQQSLDHLQLGPLVMSGTQLCALPESHFAAAHAIDVYWALQVWRNCLTFEQIGDSTPLTFDSIESYVSSPSQPFAIDSDGCYSDGSYVQSPCSDRSVCSPASYLSSPVSAPSSDFIDDSFLWTTSTSTANVDDFDLNHSQLSSNSFLVSSQPPQSIGKSSATPPPPPPPSPLTSDLHASDR
jgi:hypothetical protein